MCLEPSRSCRRVGTRAFSQSLPLKGEGIIIITVARGVKYSVERNYINLTNTAFTGDKVSNDLKCIYLSFNSTTPFPPGLDQLRFPIAWDFFLTNPENNDHMSEVPKLNTVGSRGQERGRMVNEVILPQRILIWSFIDVQIAVFHGWTVDGTRGREGMGNFNQSYFHRIVLTQMCHQSAQHMNMQKGGS